MELELNKQKITFYNNAYESGVIHEENSELIIPDSSPDMVRVVSSGGNAYVKEKSIEDGCVVLTGAVKGCVLYVAEGETAIRKLEINMPFCKKFEHSDICKDAPCIYDVCLTSLEAREINSRKLALRAHIGLNIQCYVCESIEIAEDVASKDEFSVEIQNKDIEFYNPAFIKERSFTIIDDIEISGANSDFEAMLKNDVSLTCTDKKLIGNKAVIKGIAHIKCTYMTKDGIINVMTHNLPYSQIMDIDEFEENCDLCIKMNIRASDIEPSHDMSGDARYISVNILVDTALIVYTKGCITSIDDVYSTAYDICATFESLPLKKLCGHINKRVSVNETIETANSVKKILDTGIVLSHTHKNVDKIYNDAHIQIMYMGDDDEIYCAQKKCGIECDIGANKNERVICVSNIGSETASGNENKIAVQFFVDYEISAIAGDKIHNLKSIDCGEMRNRAGDEATVIIKHIYSEQSLWNIAKKYNTTISEIADANGLDCSETVAAGSMLLIPCGK